MNNVAGISIKHSHGLTERAIDLNDALAKLRAIYGEEIETEGEFPGRVLVWQDAESAKDDDGSRAVAVLGQLVVELGE